jgi:hypothetical protein
MEVLQRPFFIICVVLFGLHQLLQWGLKIPIPIADAYLDNILLMPIVLTLWLAEKRILFKKAKGYELSPLEIIMATIYILLITEWIFPLMTTHFTTDAWDVFFTAIGSLLYYFWLLFLPKQPGSLRHRNQNVSKPF